MKDMPTNLRVSQFSTILIYNSISNLQLPARQEIVTVYTYGDIKSEDT